MENKDIYIRHSLFNKHSFKIDVYSSLLILFLITMFFADGLSKFLAVKGSGFYRISLLVRFLFEGVVLLYLIFNVNKNIVTYFELLIILFVFFMIGQVSIGNISSLSENFITFNKYIYLFLVFLFLKKYLLLSDNYKLRIERALSYLFITNIIVVVIGFVFKVPFFESYYNMDYRFGYNGFFLAANEASYVLISMIGFFYFKAYYENYNKYIFYLSIVVSLLSGMKAVYIFILLLLLFHLFIKMKLKYWLLIVLLGVVISGYIIRYVNSEDFQTLIAFFMRVYKEKGLLHMLLSGRNDILKNETILVFKDWTILNIIIGGVDINKYIIEMDFVDLFLFFGFFGSVIYLYMFYKSFIQVLLWHKFFTFFIFSVLFLAALGGHFFKSPTSAVYFTLVNLYFQNYRFRQKDLIINSKG